MLQKHANKKNKLSKRVFNRQISYIKLKKKNKFYQKINIQKRLCKKIFKFHHQIRSQMMISSHLAVINITVRNKNN